MCLILVVTIANEIKRQKSEMTGLLFYEFYQGYRWSRVVIFCLLCNILLSFLCSCVTINYGVRRLLGVFAAERAELLRISPGRDDGMRFLDPENDWLCRAHLQVMGNPWIGSARQLTAETRCKKGEILRL